MHTRSYVGIDKTDAGEWIAVIWEREQYRLSLPYPDTPLGLAALLHFIGQCCEKPKICLNPAYPGLFGLIAGQGGIPDAEVIFLSKAGLSLHLHWLPNALSQTADASPLPARRAFLLACCAERMI